MRKGDLPSLLFNYKPVPLRIIDNGHTIQVNYSPGSFFTVNGNRYELVQFHFHKPSEEKIDGKSHDMVAHLVHQGPGGKLGVIAVLLDAGQANGLIKTLWDNLPKEKDKENAVDKVMINALELIPKNKGYYTYAGSLTTPPCTQDVTWFVLQTPVQVSADEIARFGRVYPMNARPVQPVNSRDIQGISVALGAHFRGFHSRRATDGRKHFAQRPLAARREQHDARIPGALCPPQVDDAREQRRAQRARQMMAAFAPIEARAAERALLAGKRGGIDAQIAGIRAGPRQSVRASPARCTSARRSSRLS